jgi:hypothetical protein
MPLALAVPARGQLQPAESDRVVAAIVVDRLDKNIGKSVARDGELVKQALEDGFSANKDRLVLHPILDGQRVTPDGVLEFIDRLPVRPTDTLLFYFSGHGAWDETRGQYLQLYSGPTTKRGDLFRSTLVARLKGKNARLVVCLTDCCNAEAVSRARLTRDLARPVQWETLRALLLRPRGLVDMTSSAKGQLSWTYPPDEEENARPSLFTVNLVALLRAQLREGATLDWEDAYNWLKKETQEDYVKFRESFFAAYNRLPDEEKIRHKETADTFRRQVSQTVYSYALPAR